MPPLPPADFKAILAAYLDVQQSLSADSLAAVGPSARSIASRLPRVDSAEAILSPAIVLERSSDLASARTAFGRLGDALLVSIKASNMPLTDGVQVAYCPMAKKYWLQKGAEVRNPFYGQSMLDCGRIVAGIPDVK